MPTRPALAVLVLTLAMALGPAFAAPVLHPVPRVPSGMGLLSGAAVDGYARVARTAFARATRVPVSGLAWGRAAVPDLLVDTAADDQPYVAGTGAGTSHGDCTDATAGNCTLREAIEVANADAALDAIGFGIPVAGGGVATIQPVSELPALTDVGISIDGYTQPGASPNTLEVGTDAVLTVEIDGTNAGDGSSGLTFSGADQTVGGLVINRFRNVGIFVVGAGATGAVVAGNYIGTDATGAATLGNGAMGVFISAAPSARVGTDGDGTADAAERNVISGNTGSGVEVLGWGAMGAVVAGNYVGTDATGTAALGNGSVGVFINNAPSTRVGTDGDGVADAAERNVISRNTHSGVEVRGSGATGAVVAGNYVGTDATGTAALGNGIHGVNINGAPSARVGTGGDGVVDAAERNVISGNTSSGVQVAGVASTGAVVAGNYIGTDATGTDAIGNGSMGVWINGAPNTRVGTDGDGTADDAERNVISGNSANGVHAAGSSDVVAGNYIGTNAAGTGAISNALHGVYVTGRDVRVGTDGSDDGHDAAEGNVISGNTNQGVFFNHAPGFRGIVAGNYIGTDAAGTAAIPNGEHGVLVNGSNPRIGTDGNGVADADEGNRIRFNGGDGVSVPSGSASILGNAIADNGGLGIDLGADGVLANDPDDPDTGANDGQNYPVVASATSASGVDVSLDSTPSTGFRVELFVNSTADPSGHGEGERFLGAMVLTTDASGDARRSFSRSLVTVGDVVTVTATPISGGSTFGGTSEFSAAVTVTGGILVDTAADNQPFVPSTGAGTSHGDCTDGVADGDCTLREAIEVANADTALDAIGFSEAFEILPASTFPALTDAGISINGSLDSVSPGVRLNGNGGNGHGLRLGGPDQQVRGLVIVDFTGSGVLLGSDGDGASVRSNYIGADGATDLGNDQFGVFVEVGNDGSTLEGNVLSGNETHGVYAVQATGLVVAGNTIGLTADGTAALGNTYDGIVLDQSPGALIADNTISGNGDRGVYVAAGSDDAVLTGNTIGLDAAGAAALGNGGRGVHVVPSGARIGTDGDGTDDAAERNVISGNVSDGVHVEGESAAGAGLAGNYIGTDATGLVDHGNGARGVHVQNAPNADVGPDNVIAGNAGNGVLLIGAKTTGAVVEGNLIGLGSDGATPLANLVGVWINGAPAARIGTNGDGTDDAAERNVISGNTSFGVMVQGTTATGAVIAGNYVGTDAGGTLAVGNTSTGVYIDGVSSVRVGTNGNGTADAAEGNVLSANGAAGLAVVNVGATKVVVAGNRIGTNAEGTGALGNTGRGVFVQNVPGIRIGTNGNGVSDDIEGNLISGNGLDGVIVIGASASGAVIAGNVIGLDLAGTTALPNQLGVKVLNASGARIGTDGNGSADAAERNVISGNTGVGVLVEGATSTSVVVAGNTIGLPITGDALVGNQSHGVEIVDAPAVRVGTNADGTADDAEGNRIAGNALDGVYVRTGAGAWILGNAIRGNGGLGIDLQGGSEDGNGVTANDANDPDAGANGLQNFPVLGSIAAGDASVSFTLDSTPSTTFRVELFADAGDPSGHGEGGRFIGATAVTTDASGDAAGALPLTVLFAGETVFAAAATPVVGAGFGGTSEFSAAVAGVERTVAEATLDGPAGWRMLASPEATTVGAFLGTFWTQGFAGSDNPDTDACNVYRYDEPAASFAEGWACVADAADPLAPGQGLMVFLFDDDDPTTPEIDGGEGGSTTGWPKRLATAAAADPSGPFRFGLAYSANGRSFTQRGWNLLGAPSGAGLRWGDVTRSQVGSTVYVYDPVYPCDAPAPGDPLPDACGDYRTWTLDGGFGYGDLTDGVIPSFQGFFVHALAAPCAGAAAPDCAFLEAPLTATTGGGGTYGREAAPTVVRLSLADTTGERSAAWLSLSGRGALGPDATDAVRLEPTAWPRAVLYTTPVEGEATPLVANALPADLGGGTFVEVPLGVALGGFAGEVALTLAATADDLPDGWTLTLVDRTTGTETPLTAGAPAPLALPGDGAAARSEQTLAAGLPAAAALRGAGPSTRFVLRIATEAFVTALPGDDALTTGLGRVFPNPASGRAAVDWALAEAGDARLVLFDLLGREVAVLAEGPHAAGVRRSEVPAGRLAAGVYVVRLQAGTVTEAARFTVAR